MDKNITGLMVYYYFVCGKKLWYFANEIAMEQYNMDVKLGKVLDENSYSRDEKHINIDNVINIDFIRSKNVLHEVKKSNKIEEASIWQVKYYLYYLQQRGISVNAKIDYPLLKETLDVTLSQEDCRYLDTVLQEIETIISQETPMDAPKKKFCKACAYYDLCFI